MDCTIEDLQITEPVQDSDNFITEASIDARGDEVVLAYVRMRGLAHGDDGSIMLIRSQDRGQTWDQSTHVVAMEQRKTWGFTSPGLKLLRDGTIIVVAHANAEVALRHRQQCLFRGGYIARSTDGGITWSVPEPIKAYPIQTPNIWDNPLELEDGSLLLGVSGTVTHARATSATAGHFDPSRAALLKSDDLGETWFCIGTIAYDPAGLHIFHEPGVALLPDGRLISLCRQHYEVCQSNPPGGFLFFAESSDGGASWTPFRKTGLWGYPADPVVLLDGSVLCAYGHRTDLLCVKIALSRDGRTWEEACSRILYEAPNFTAEAAIQKSRGTLDTGYRHIGYPSCTALDDGRILTVFHSFDEQRKQIVLLASYGICSDVVS